MASRPTDDERKLLNDLYKNAVEEYRFQVRLNWDRTRYFLALNTALVGLAGGLLRIESQMYADVLVALILMIGIVTSRIGISSLVRGHEYYRRIIVQKTELERQLGLIDIDDKLLVPIHRGISTTQGMGNLKMILTNRDAYARKPLERGSVSNNIVNLFKLIILVDIGGIVAVIAKHWCAVVSVALSLMSLV